MVKIFRVPRVISTRLMHPLLFSMVLWSSTTNAQDASVNYNELKIPPYQLVDPLTLANGQHINDPSQWIRQRQVFLQLFAENVYGRIPGKPAGLHFKITGVDSAALAGKAVRKQVTIYFSADPAGPSMDLLVFLPAHAVKPVPVFMGLNFYGNQAVSSDAGIALARGWSPNDPEKHLAGNHSSDASRGTDSSKWPVEELLSRGYGLATAYYGDLEPDHPEGWKTGIRTTLKSSLNINETEWSAMAAWAWGLSRILDYLVTDPAVDSKRVVITGHSRLGKAALWAAANDERFAMVVSNNSGEGGAALSSRWYGETVRSINTAFPHWFVSKYKTFNEDPRRLPVDQHILLSLMAPRPLYVASATEDQWADPKGEFLSAKHAGAVYALFGKKGLGVDEMPVPDRPVGETIRYHIRTGKHDITRYDWRQYLDFADQQLGR
jgi:dienelactone hydrolase